MKGCAQSLLLNPINNCFLHIYDNVSAKQIFFSFKIFLFFSIALKSFLRIFLRKRIFGLSENLLLNLR